MKKLIILFMALLCFFNMAAMFESFNYMQPEKLKGLIEAGTQPIIVDIQVEDEFTAHHFPGSIETNAFPVKTDAQRKQIDVAVKAYKVTGDNVVVVCPRGGGGAKRCYAYLKSQGVPEEKLTILEGGIAKWPYSGLLAKK